MGSWWRRKWEPTPVPGESHDEISWAVSSMGAVGDTTDFLLQLKEQAEWVLRKLETPGRLGSWLEGAPDCGAERRLPLLLRRKNTGPGSLRQSSVVVCLCGLGEPGRHIISSPWSHTQPHETWGPGTRVLTGGQLPDSSASPEFRSSEPALGVWEGPTPEGSSCSGHGVLGRLVCASSRQWLGCGGADAFHMLPFQGRVGVGVPEGHSGNL